eukprot:CAMPEP_0184867448 /NCGR_PEP_ID=MMETSP0580-20130426/26598_1 /TAXON_ID=1118495 /ORGANISM="Dactyliosolen fragilissimus" /LENGTH=280 /DNA_ID=CAMNT_0027367749 /DNA_START=571 /DNA_END=1413 /DNA_ORIENTATION=+
MMHEFVLYTPIDVATVQSPRYRALYEGVAAGATEPDVLKAFTIIFEDLVPIRIAGRMIYKHLKSVMEKSISARNEQEERVASTTGLTPCDIHNGRRAFLAILPDQEQEEGGSLTIEQLVNSGIVETIMELLEIDTLEDFVDRLEKDEDGKIDFEKFMISLQKCTDDTVCDVNCNLSEVLEVVITRMEPIEIRKKELTISERKVKYSNRYDEMVRTFEQWEDMVPSRKGRMVDVLKGCFAGAKNESIVNALKIVYMDYSALRLGGDLVFKLMTKVVNGKRK